MVRVVRMERMERVVRMVKGVDGEVVYSCLGDTDTGR